MNIKQKSLSESFLNRNYRSILFAITCLKNIDQTNVTVLEISYFQWHTGLLNANKIDIKICQSLLICFIVFVHKI